MEKLKKKKLPPVNPKVHMESTVAQVKMNDDFLTEKERQTIVTVTTPPELKKKKPRVILNLPVRPPLQRFTKPTGKDTSKDPVQEINRYQETNLAHGYMEKFVMKPGVSLQLGANYKTRTFIAIEQGSPQIDINFGTTLHYPIHDAELPLSATSQPH